MSEHEIDALVNSYWKWMKDRTILKTVKDGWVEVNTPFMDRHNDGLQIYVRKVGDYVEITDDGYAISDLESSGCSLKTDKQVSFLNKILNTNGVKLDDGSLYMKVPMSEFPSRKNDFITTMQQIGDLYTTSKGNVYSLFSDEIALWLESKDMYPHRNIKIQGTEGITYSLDFLFARVKNAPEKALQAIGTPTKHNVSWVIVMNEGLSKNRNIQMHIMLNDERMSQRMKKEVTLLSNSHGLHPHLWSNPDTIFTMDA